MEHEKGCTAMTQNWRVRLEVFGKVQGVFYRASTRDKARELGLSGWVRNRRDGSVEAVVEGGKDKVEALVEWTREGPPQARVDGVEVTQEEYVGDFSIFEVRR